MKKQAGELTERAAIQAGFDELFRRISNSGCLAEAWEVAFGDEYPDEASPFSFLTRTELEMISRTFSDAAVRRFIDLGCGCGGPTRAVARRIGADGIGIDASAVAIEQAKKRAAAAGAGGRCEFQQADAERTNLPARSFGAVLSVDALQLMPDPTLAVAEAARLLQPNGLFGFTTWCISSPWRQRAVVPDYRPVLEANGFKVLVYREPDGWKERQMRVYSQILQRTSQLEAEIGSRATEHLVAEASGAPEALAKCTRILALARRGPP